MAQDQKRNPHRTEEGTRLRTVAGENETPEDPKNLRLEETRERSCTHRPPQDEPEVGAPRGAISDLTNQEQRQNSNLSFEGPDTMNGLDGCILQHSAALPQLLDLQLVT